jgi:TatD DNase family protein
MNLADTHCHLDFPDFRDDLDEVIDRARAAGVVRMVVPGTDIKSSQKAIDITGKYHEVFASVGIHPHEADKVTDFDVSRLRDLATGNDKVVAVGEIGLDHYKGYSDRGNQMRLFRGCVKLAKELDLPVILHNREAGKDLLGVLKEDDFNTLRGVIHCFSGDQAFLREVLAMDYYVSFAGNITYDKAQDLRDLAKNVPLEKLLLETDAPYITPAPKRGKRNEPANVLYLLDVYSEIYGMSKDDIAEATTGNANRLFRLGTEKQNTFAYQIRDSLYLNVTYRCTNRCNFCTREVSNYVQGYDLKLDKEPTYDELILAMGNVAKYKEVVFCGFGEPTLRLEMIKQIGSYVKGKGVKVRLTTNGEANLIYGRKVAPELAGAVDRVSVSLNSPDEDTYMRLCHPVFGGRTYEAILDFITECKQQGMEVEITCLDVVGEEGVEKCRRIAQERGAEFRLRHLHVVG